MFDKIMQAVTEKAAGGSGLSALESLSGALGGQNGGTGSLGGLLGGMLGGGQTDGTSGKAGGFDFKFLVSAAMMVIAAKRDGKIDQTEMASIVQTVTQHFGLNLGNAQGLVESAVGQLNVPGAETAFTQAVKNGFDEQDRQGLMGMLWQVLGQMNHDPQAPQMNEETIRGLGHDIGLDDGAIDAAKAAPTSPA